MWYQWNCKYRTKISSNILNFQTENGCYIAICFTTRIYIWLKIVFFFNIVYFCTLSVLAVTPEPIHFRSLSGLKFTK